MIRTLFLILTASITFSTNCLAQFDTVYFGQNWDTTSKSEAQYYRTPMIETDSGYLFKDYYISGNLQFDGFTLEPTREIMHGTVKFYYEEGGLKRIKSYKNGKEDGEEIFFLKNGKEIARGVNKNDSVVQGTFLYEYEDYESLITVEDRNITKTIIFDLNNLEGARYTAYLSDGNRTKVDFYGNNGEFLGTGDSLVYEVVFNGVQVDYYYNPMRVETISTVRNGYIIDTSKSFFINGKLRTIDYYEDDGDGNSQHSKSVYFNVDGKRLDSLFYKDGNAWKGTQCLYYTKFNNESYVYQKIPYDEGLINGFEQIFHENGHLKEENEYTDGKKSGKYVSYNENGVLAATCQMQDGQPYNGEIYNSSAIFGYKEGEVLYEKHFYSTGELQTEKNYADGYFISKYYNKDGSEIGTFEDKYNYENGIEVFFEDDVIYSKRFFVEGECTNEQIFVNQILVEDIKASGESKFYDFINDVTYRCTYQYGFPWEGVVASITSDGVSGYTEYKDGKRNGISRSYRQTYNTQKLYKYAEETYQNDVLHGVCKYYSENGKLAQVTYENEMRHSLAQYYDFKGNLLSSVEFNWNRVINGKCYSYSDDYISASETYANEFLIMEEKYYPNNKLIASRRIIYDSLSPQTTIQLFYENGQIKEEWEKQYNDPHGSYVAYLPNGTVLAKGLFDNGLPKSGTFAYFHFFEQEYKLLKVEGNKVLLDTYLNGSKYSSETYIINKGDNFQDRMYEIMEDIRSKNYAYDYFKS